ncbi:membrane dipeptidase, partial [Salinicola sp.]|uniref:membrane dipeptidase n=1 Tax=Salinicola sp. TaxID=1978524 RepID=UPI0025F4E345
MSTPSLHDDAIIIDGLIIAKWDRALFEDMRKGGLTAANCTVSVWEDFESTVDNIVAVNQLMRDNAELVRPVHTTRDITRAKEEGKTGIILGFQNAYAFEDKLGYIEIFKKLGVGITQLCYNTQNLVGTGCYERDGGLSGYGREVIAEMNRVGMMCDLSHVGSKTSEEIILESKKPVCYSHCLPSGLKEHPRNKSDDELKFIADHGGFVGVTMFTPFLKAGVNATVEDYVEAIVYIMNIVGEDFRDGILFVPEVLLAANAMKVGMAILRPLLAETGAKPVGKMVIGTVKGDIHDIGKNLVTMMLEGAGFEVIDLGINTDVEEYLDA